MKERVKKNNFNAESLITLFNTSELPIMICTQYCRYDYWCDVFKNKDSAVTLVEEDVVIIQSLDKKAKLTAEYDWFNYQTKEQIIRNVKRFIYGSERNRSTRYISAKR